MCGGDETIGPCSLLSNLRQVEKVTELLLTEPSNAQKLLALSMPNPSKDLIYSEIFFDLLTKQMFKHWKVTHFPRSCM